MASRPDYSDDGLNISWSSREDRDAEREIARRTRHRVLLDSRGTVKVPSLLVERRGLCNELRFERDPVVRGLLEFQIAEIDRQLEPSATDRALAQLREGGLL